MRLAALILIATALALPVDAAQADITGRPRIIDGDIIQIRDQRIRLFGISTLPLGSDGSALSPTRGQLDGDVLGDDRAN